MLSSLHRPLRVVSSSTRLDLVIINGINTLVTGGVAVTERASFTFTFTEVRFRHLVIGNRALIRWAAEDPR